MHIAQGFRALSLSTVSGLTPRPFAVDDIVCETRRPFPNRVLFFW